MFRALWPTTVALWQATRQFRTGCIGLEHLIRAATINIAVLYVFGDCAPRSLESLPPLTARNDIDLQSAKSVFQCGHAWFRATICHGIGSLDHGGS